MYICSLKGQIPIQMVSEMGRTTRIIAGIMLLTVLLVVSLSSMPSADAAFTGSEPASSGDTAWILVCSILVAMMLPGVAFFYGGMLRKQSMTSVMAQTLIATGIMTLSWVILGFSLLGEGLSTDSDAGKFF